MLNRIQRVAVTTALCALVSTGAGSEPMSQKLTRPATVPLDFLAWVAKDPTWLRACLAEQGVTFGYAITDGVLEASTAEALRAANRLRAFAHLAAPSLRLPYFDLVLDEAGGEKVRCVTLFPRSVVPEIGAPDFARRSFPAAAADASILKLCRVDVKTASAYASVDRDAFRSRFFDAAGDLKIEFVELAANPAFIGQAIDYGYFVIQQDVTGRPRLIRE